MSLSKDLFLSFDKHVCFSGGAEGADLTWSYVARKHDHIIIHWSFSSHTTKANKDDVYIINQNLLEENDTLLFDVAKILKRKFDPHNQYIANLIRRNYWQVCWSSSLYGVGWMKNGNIEGGTAWSFCLANIFNIKQQYFFDQYTDVWYEYDYDRWKVIKNPPQPEGLWTGIGSRNLKNNGSREIANIFKDE
jgi:hypothetical protein